MLINLLPLPDYLDQPFDILDLPLVSLPEYTPSGTDDGTIEPDTAYALWETGYDLVSGYPEFQFDDKFSMRVNWIVDLPLTNPLIGSYQVEIEYSLDIHLFEDIQIYVPGSG